MAQNVTTQTSNTPRLTKANGLNKPEEEAWVIESGSTRFSPNMPATALNSASVKVPVVSMISKRISLLRLRAGVRVGRGQGKQLFDG